MSIKTTSRLGLTIILGAALLPLSKTNAHNSCQAFLGLKSDAVIVEQASFKLEGEPLFRAFETALDKALSVAPEKATAEELKKLRSPSKVMTILKRMTGIRGMSAEFSLWTSLERDIFHRPETENLEFVREVEVVFNRFTDSFKDKSLNRLYDTLSKGRLGTVEARVALGEQLKILEVIFSEVYGERISLFEEQGWVRILGISDFTQIAAKTHENALLNRNLNERISSMLARAESPSTIYTRLSREFFGDSGVGLHVDARNFLMRNIKKPAIIDLIKELRLDAKKEQKYLSDLELVSQGQFGYEYRTRLGMVMVLFKAYLEVNDHIPAFTNVTKEERYFSSRSYLGIYNRLHHTKILRAILDEKYSHFVEKTDLVNARLTAIENQLTNLKKRYPLHEAEFLKLEDELSAIPKVRDFQDDVEATEIKVKGLERQKDLLAEKILTEVRNENINLFEDLNLRWSRLIADKSYELRGVDYRYVRFTSDVIENFELDPVTGSRFLAALSKSYVSIKNASGLRRLQGIHHDFRDIKVLKTGGKIRIVGRIIGDTIHFFHIYQSDKPYNNKAMEHLIETYRPE